jgi:hypothetical protein
MIPCLRVVFHNCFPPPDSLLDSAFPPAALHNNTTTTTRSSIGARSIDRSIAQSWRILQQQMQNTERYHRFKLTPLHPATLWRLKTVLHKIALFSRLVSLDQWDSTVLNSRHCSRRSLPETPSTSKRPAGDGLCRAILKPDAFAPPTATNGPGRGSRNSKMTHYLEIFRLEISSR